MRLVNNEREMLSQLVRQFPEFETFVSRVLAEELEELPQAQSDKVQVFQGRSLVLQELRNLLRDARGFEATRTPARPVERRSFD
jgi:hypothetical protein